MIASVVRLSEHIEPALPGKLLSQITLAEGPHGEVPAHAPFTGGVLANIPAGTEADVERAVALARKAQPWWAARSFSARAGIFLRFHDLLLKRQDEILDLIQLKTARPAATHLRRFSIPPSSPAITPFMPNGSCGRAAERARCPC